jgi:hypothetical protein
MEGVDQLFIMSCYVSREGWAVIATQLARLLTTKPTAQIRLYFSLEGTTSVGRSLFYDALIAFFDRHRTHTVGEHPSLQVLLVPDRVGSLFHPKGCAVRAGRRFAVSIGSANLTQAGHGSNHELELTCEDPETFYEFVAAAQKLEATGLARPFNVPNVSKLRDYLADRETRRRAFARTLAPHPREEGSDRESAIESALEDASMAPIPMALTETLADIRNAITVGCRVVEQDLGLPNLSVSLRPFVNAGIVTNPPQRTIAPGIKVGGGSSTTLLISLVPDEIIEAMKTIHRRQGFLLREFSINILGVRWMPVEWEPAFIRHWTLCREMLGDLPLKAVDEHLDHLHSDLSHRDFVYRLGGGLEIELNTARWKTKAATKLFANSDICNHATRGEILSTSMKVAVLAEIAEYVRARVMSKLDRDTARFQVERVGSSPRFDHMPQVSVENDDALDFVATMSEVVTRETVTEDPDLEDDPRNRDDRRQRGGTGVRRALVSLLQPGSRSQLRGHALQLRRCLTDKERSPDQESELLIAAWYALKRAFIGGDFPRSWSSITPKWEPAWTKEPEKRKKPKQFVLIESD